MSALREVLDDPLAQRVGWVLLHSVWQGAVIGGVFELLRFALRRRSANLRYLAGCFMLLLLFALPVITFFHVASVSSSFDGVSSFPEFTGGVAVVSQVANGTFPANVPHSLAQLSTDFFGTLAPWLAVVWSLGVVLFSLKLTRSWWWVGKIRTRETEPVESVWMRRLDELRSRLRISRPVRLLKSALVEVPTVIGWLRPVILLPAASLAGLTPAQLEAILAHELAHVRRFDYLVNAFQCLVETLMFYHPVVWWISRCVREERENCCDDLVVEVCGDRVAYARALATLEECRVDVPAMAFAASGGSLLQRIRRLLGATNEGRPANARQMGGLALLGVGLVLVALGVSIHLRPNLYQAVATLGVGHNPVAQTQSKNGDNQSDSATSSHLQLTGIKSPLLLRRVIDELKLAGKWNEHRNGGASLHTADAIALLDRRTRVQTESDTGLVKIQVLDEDPEEAARIANAIATTYRDQRLEQSTNFMEAGINALEKKWRAQQEKVHEAQVKVDKLRVELNIYDPNPTGTQPPPTISLDAQHQLQANLIAFKGTEVSLETQLKNLEKLPRSELRGAIQTALGTPDANLAALFGELDIAQQRVLNLQRDYSPDHPVYINAERSVKDLNDKIDKAVDGILLGLQNRLDATKASVNELNQELANAKSNDLAMIEKTRPYYEAKQALAAEVQFKTIIGMKIAAEQTDLELPRNSLVFIAEQATPAHSPIAPNRPLATALIALGLTLGIVGVVLLKGKPALSSA